MVPVFNKEKHAYVDPQDNFKYQSVTQWVNQYKKPFAKQQMAQRTATKRGITVEQVLQEWDKQRNDSTEFGTKVHKILETFFVTGNISTDGQHLVESFNMLNLNIETKFSHFEKIVYSKDYGIAGTADIIEDINSEIFNVYDFKTNKAFNITSKYNDFLLPPFQNFPNTEYFVYALQLSLYAYLYEIMSQKFCNRLTVIWLNRDNKQSYDSYTGTWHVFNVPYLRNHLHDALSQKLF